MTVAIIYASHHGHTRRVCDRIADDLRERGAETEVLASRDLQERFSLKDYEAAILAGSVHYGRHPRELERFATQHREELDSMPSAWISVSLAAADPKSADEAQATASQLPERSGWHPSLTAPVAGALPYSRYNRFLRFFMKQVARVSGAASDTSRDHDYTDWDQVDALAARIGETLRGVPPDRGPQPSA